MKFLVALILTAGLWSESLAAPATSLRPVARPGGEVGAAGVRPRARPQAGGTVALLATMGSLSSLRPRLRPPGVAERAMSRKRRQARGALCGDPDLQGEPVGYVPGRINGCGIKDAVSLRSVDGARLSTPATVDCRTATALKRWVNRGVRRAIGNRGGGLEELRVVAHYACRTRNNQPGAKISEHGRGRAIDIAGFRLRDGSEISVLDDWGRGREGRILRKIHKSACGTFGTVLGPESDRFHQDHFHVDTARHRGGAYCR